MNLYLSENRPLRLGTLCLLYAAQGLPDGFVRIALKTYLIGQGISTDALGNVVAMVSWPWSLKFVWGPFIDRFGYAPMGRRRPWILFAQFMMIVALMAMLLIPDLTANLTLLAFMVLAVNIFASLQDVSVDALAVDLLPARERGVANGFMYGSNYAGSFVGGKVLGSVIQHYGFPLAIKVQSLLLACISAFPLLLRERRGDEWLPGVGGSASPSSSATVERPSSLAKVFGLWARAFSLRSTLLAALLAVLSLITVNGHLMFWPRYAQRELGWSQTQWLTLEGGQSVWLGLVGSLLGGYLASVIGPKRTVILSLVGMSMCWFAYALWAPDWGDTSVVRTLFLAEAALGAFLQVSMFALFMGLCWPPVAATQFTTYMALLNVSNGLGAIFADRFETHFSMPGAHVAMGCIEVALVAIVLAIDANETRRKLGEGQVEILSDSDSNNQSARPLS
jgi:PAT family beta-lactamase induction signal transducer AmpG